MSLARMKRLFFVILTLLILLPSMAEAQRWKRFRRQVVGGIGATNFLGELGGGNNIGRPGPADLDVAATRPAALIGYRYQLNSYVFLRSNLTWGILRGDDKFTQEPFRRGRNLRFRTGFFELNVMGEFYMLNNARGNLYRLRGVRGRRGLGLDVYLFGGIGLMHFNPKGQDQNGDWVALQPIGTEGQGLPGEPDKYNRLVMTIPYGIGLGKTIDRYWQVNFEFTMRFTFTDYLDDVSTDYYGRDNLRQAKLANGASQAEADQAAYLSDPNIYHTMPEVGIPRSNQLVGETRGNPDFNDTFMTGMITISRKIVQRRRSRPKF